MQGTPRTPTTAASRTTSTRTLRDSSRDPKGGVLLSGCGRGEDQGQGSSSGQGGRTIVSKGP